MPRPQLWLIAGPNGAGKTTAMSSPQIRGVSSHVRFLNADDRTLEKLRADGWPGFAAVPLPELTACFIAAAEKVYAELMDGIEAGRAVGAETVLSTHKYKPAVERIRALGGAFHLIYVGLRHPDLSAQRVALRVVQGGHDVPTDKLAARWARSVENLGWHARQADQFFVFDNSEGVRGQPPLLIAEGGAGEITIHAPEAIPALTASLTAAFA